MYCGTNKTALQSQRQIANAMMALLGQKPFAQITVSEVCKAAGISRQTFYTLFTSRENVMVFTLQSRACCAPGAAHGGGAGLRTFTVSTVYAVSSSTSGYPIFSFTTKALEKLPLMRERSLYPPNI